jgi:hypothetical protein
MNYMRVPVKFLQIFKPSSSEAFEVYENKMILTVVVASYRRNFMNGFAVAIFKRCILFVHHFIEACTVLHAELTTNLFTFRR